MFHTRRLYVKLRFIEYLGEIFIVLGITYDQTLEYPDVFIAVPLKYSFVKSTLNINTVKIPLVLANEICDKSTLKTLMILYGE